MSNHGGKTWIMFGLLVLRWMMLSDQTLSRTISTVGDWVADVKSDTVALVPGNASHKGRDKGMY